MRFIDKKPSILIVDDTPENLEVLANTLNEHDYDIIAALSGMEALSLAEEESPDLILLDIMMPEMDGYETCRRLKESPKTKETPIIFLTAKVKPEDIVKGFETGGVDYITKPFNTTELLARVNTHLELKFAREKSQIESNKRKELIHVLCHDLKNPIGSLKGVHELIFEDPTLLEDMKEAMKISTTNCLDIIDSVRVIMSLDSGKQKLTLSVYKVQNLLAIAETIIQQQLKTKNITIKSDIEPDLEVLVDKTSFINSVLNNLFSNAIKFSFPGSVIEFKAWKEKDKSVISIRDFGIGMPERIAKGIFETESTVSRVGTNGETGTGFGMPLVKKFILAYGGSISLETKEKSEENPDDHGTTFTIKLNAKTGLP